MEEEMGRVSVAVGAQTDERIGRVVGQGEEHKDAKEVTVHTVCAQADGSFRRREPEDGELLPGLPNDIVWHIVPKLAWRDFNVLSPVSCRWREAIQSRQVFNARVRSHSTETFVVIRSCLSDEISLFSVRDKSCHRLPPISHLGRRRNLKSSGITALDGKIYVLGGVTASDEGGSKNVYVFDPAAQRGWKMCTEMLERRYCFDCGVVDGKLYVFGGLSGGNAVCLNAEVYDPKANAWSQIATMPDTRSLHEVFTLGEEMFLCRYPAISPPGNSPSLLAYHTVKDEWRVVQPFPQHDGGRIFIARGKFHLWTWRGIDVLDEEKNTWQHLHSVSSPSLQDGVNKAGVYDVIAVNEELFSAMSRYNIGMDDEDKPYEKSFVLLQSEGFRRDREELLCHYEAAFPEGFTLACTVEL